MTEPANQSSYSGIKRSILSSIILVPLVVMLLVLSTGYYFFASFIETSTVASLKRIVQDHGHMIDTFLSERQRNLGFVLQSYSFEALTDPEFLGTVLKRLQSESHAFVDLGVFNEEGLHVAYEGPFRLAGLDYKDADWFKEVKRKGYYLSDVFLGYRRVPHFVIALVGEAGPGKWILRSTIDTNVFSDRVKSVQIGKTGEAYLLNQEGRLQTQRKSGGDLMTEDPDRPEHLPEQESVKTFIQKGAGGVSCLYATTWLKEKNWLLVVRQEKADAFKSLYAAVYWIVLIMIVGGSVIFGLAFYLTGRIERRLRRSDAEKERLTQQLLQAGRLAELGEMAAGFAHEINNPLQIIQSEQSLIKSILSEMQDQGRLMPSEDLAEIEDSMKQIRLQLERCAKITHSILRFSRQTEPVFQTLDTKGFLIEVAGIIEKRASVHGIALRHEISPGTPMVHADPAQLQQVFVNLYNNAIDAILERHGPRGGELTVTACRDPQGKAEITVRDNGTGISPENLNKIFTPFFTTKPVGKGTGLGLSVCYGIIDSMGGEMGVKSEKGLGSTFTIRLPAAS